MNCKFKIRILVDQFVLYTFFSLFEDIHGGTSFSASALTSSMKFSDHEEVGVCFAMI